MSKDAWLDELPNLVLPSAESSSPQPKSTPRKSKGKSPTKSYHQVAQSVVVAKFAGLRQEMLDAALKALTQYFLSMATTNYLTIDLQQLYDRLHGAIA